jgi:hypothetical protein
MWIGCLQFQAKKIPLVGSLFLDASLRPTGSSAKVPKLGGAFHRKVLGRSRQLVTTIHLVASNLGWTQMWPESHLLCCRVYSCLLSMIIFVWFQTLHILHLHHENRIRWSAIGSFLLRCGRLNNQTHVPWISKKYRTSIRSLLPGAMSLHSFLGFLLLLAAACSAADSTGGLKRCWSYVVADGDFAFICSHVSGISIYFPFIFHLFSICLGMFHEFP